MIISVTRNTTLKFLQVCNIVGGSPLWPPMPVMSSAQCLKHEETLHLIIPFGLRIPSGLGISMFYNNPAVVISNDKNDLKMTSIIQSIMQVLRKRTSWVQYQYF